MDELNYTPYLIQCPCCEHKFRVAVGQTLANVIEDETKPETQVSDVEVWEGETK